MGRIIEILWDYRLAFWSGLQTTLALAGIIWTGGIIFGSLFALAAHHDKRFSKPLISCAAFIVSAIPILVLLYWAHFPLQSLFDVVIPPFYTAAAVLAIANTFGVYEIVRHALGEVPAQYETAAKVCGLSRWEILRFIRAPLVIRHALPGVINLQVFMLQCTLFASTISVEELFRAAQRINAQVYRPVEIYTAMALFFVLTCGPILLLSNWLRRRYMRDLSER